MHKIRSEYEMKQWQKTRALLSVYVDDGYDVEYMNAIFGARRAFDTHARDAWHMLIPYAVGYAVDRGISEGNFNLELAQKIIQKNGLAHAELPALIFESATENEDNFIAKLGGFTPREVVNMVAEIADIALDMQKNGPTDFEEFRGQSNDRVRVYLNRKKALRLLKGVPKIGGFIGAAKDAKDLFN